jgi:microcystin-dependent protein
MSYDLYPAVDEDYQFAPEVRAALAASTELRNQVVPMTETQRNNLAGAELWNGRLILNTTSNRIDRYDGSDWVAMTTEPAGVVKMYAGATAPEFHALLDGAVVDRAGIHAALFGVIGTTYNTGGELSTQFRLPNMKGRVAVGVDSSQTEFNALGETGGAKTHTLVTGEMPSHNHGGATATDGGVDHLHNNSITDGAGAHQHIMNLGNDGMADGGLTTQSYVAGAGTTDGAGAHNHAINNGASDRSLNHPHAISAQGGGAAHNNLQPFVAMNYIITL